MVSAWIFLVLVATPQVAVSEFQAVNDTIIEDEDGDRSDWIELVNRGGQVVDLAGWALTDDDQLQDLWKFPSNTLLQPNEYLLIFASDKNRRKSGKELHTNFKLSGGGETLALLRADGSVAQDFGTGFPSQFEDVSYGYADDGAGGYRLGYFMTATPGAENTSVGPVVTVVEPDTEQLLPGQDLLIVAQVDPSTPAAAVDLKVRRMFDAEQLLAMRDDGSGGDAIAADGLWSALVPGGTAQTGELLRWAVEAYDTQGGVGRSPGFALPKNSAEYYGTIVQDPALSSELPVYHWFVEDTSAAGSASGTRACLWHAGEYYDHIHVRRRGGSSASWPKRSFKFDFNRGQHFRYQADRGRVSELNLNTTWSDKSALRRVLGWEAFERAGQPGSAAFNVHLRQNAEFFSLTTFVEQPDEDMLDRFGWDEDGVGPLYKMYNVLDRSNSGIEKKTRTDENNSDLKELVQGLKLTGDAQRDFLFDHVDIPAVINYIAVTNLIHNNDHIAKNYYVYRDVQTDDEWWFIPWDLDLTHGRNYTFSGGVLNDTIWADENQFSHPLFGDRDRPKNDGPWNRLIDAIFQHEETRELYIRRFRTLMDEVLDSPQTPRSERWYEQRMDELQALMGPEIALDLARWGVPAYGDRTQEQAEAQLVLENDYLAVRRQYLFETLGPNGTQEVPAKQALAPRLGFGVIEAQPGSGLAGEAYFELINAEATPVDLSGWRVQGDVEFQFMPGTVIGAGGSIFVSPDLRAFRARLQSPSGGESRLLVGPFDGALSTLGALQLLDGNGDLVARTDGGPLLVPGTCQAGDPLALRFLGGTPGGMLGVAYSLAGAGPTPSPYGLLALSAPIQAIPQQRADAWGMAVWESTLPSSLAGSTLWIQGWDAASNQLSPGISCTLP